MLTLADIPSARAEAATYRANELLADFRLTWDAVGMDSPRAQDIARDALFRLITIAEMFAGERLLELVDQNLPRNELVARLWEERAPRIIRDWPNRKSSWSDLLDVEWKYRGWSELNGFVTARNIIAHGMGQLTRSQLRLGSIRRGVMTSLAQAKLRLDGHQLMLSADNVERCGTRVIDFIDWLDTQSRV